MKYLATTVTVAFGLLSVPAYGQASRADPVVLTVSKFVPEGHVIAQAMGDWCGQVTKATDNRVVCEMLPKPVAPPPQTFDAIRDGLADLSFSVHGYAPGRFVLTEMSELPFLGENAANTSTAYQRIYEKHLAPLDEHRGLKVITVFTHGPGKIFNTKRPIASLDDLRGLKFRVGGGMVNRIGEALGANVTLKPAPESYELLSSGVMDGVFFPDDSIKAYNLEKLIKHGTSFPGGLYNTSFAFVMNPEAWDRISPEDQKAIEALSGEAAARLFGSYWDKGDAAGRAAQSEAGIETTKADAAFVDEVKEKTSSIEEDWIARAKEQGLDDPAAVLEEFRAEIAKEASQN